MASLTVHIGADHAGVELKTALIKLLPGTTADGLTFTWKDHGPQSASVSVDYPDYAVTVSKAILADRAAGKPALGLLICGSGIGICIAANKVDGINAAQIENPVAARLAKLHNNADIMCLGARFIAADYAAEMAKIFIETPFSNEPRHQKRVEKIRNLEQTP